MADQNNAAENAVASEVASSEIASTDADNTPASETTAVEDNQVEDSAVEENSAPATPVAQDTASEETPARPERVNTPQPELSEALSPLGNQSDEPRKEVENGRPYEIIFIARVGDDEAVEASTQRLRELVEGGQGAIDNVRTSEVRRLAYPIQKEMEGIYVVVNGRFAKEMTSEIDRFFKLEDAVLRHMLLRDEA